MEDELKIERTPELERYLVEQGFAMMALANWIRKELVEQLYDMQKEKVLKKEDILFIVEKVIEQYNYQFGFDHLLKDEKLKNLARQVLEEKEENGEIEIAKQTKEA